MEGRHLFFVKVFYDFSLDAMHIPCTVDIPGNSNTMDLTFSERLNQDVNNVKCKRGNEVIEPSSFVSCKYTPWPFSYVKS